MEQGAAFGHNIEAQLATGFHYLLALIARAGNAGLVRTQNGRVRTYACVMVLGVTVILISLVLTSGGGT